MRASIRSFLRPLVRTARRTALTHGLVYTGRPRFSADLQPLYLRHVIDRHSIQCVVDVGANRGQFSGKLRSRIGYTGPIHAFEPTPNALGLLKKWASGERDVTIHPFALGADNTEGSMNVMKMGVLNSFRTPRRGAIDVTPNKVKEKITVPIRRFDSVVSEDDSLSSIDRFLVKIDTQGFDIEVVRGIGAKMDRVVAILMEVPILSIYEEAPTFGEIVDEMKSLGFVLSAMTPVSHAASALIEVDGLFLNSTHLKQRKVRPRLWR